MTIEVTRGEVDDDHPDSRDHWIARRDGEVIGAVHSWQSPDGRQRLYFDDAAHEAYRALLDPIAGACQTVVDESDSSSLEALREFGFVIGRRELLLEIPVTVTDHPIPEQYRVISAVDAEVRPLLVLDNVLRDQVPGADGWVSDERWFREENYESPYFDPETYLVAIDTTGQYVGLVRIWNGPRPLPRLGMIGVLPRHRGRGLARGLLSQAFNILAGRGETTCTTEADELNAASVNLLRSFGAVTVGAELELVRESRI